MSNCGKQCIWVGYATEHAVRTYRVLNPETRKILLTRDVIFLGKSYGKWAIIEDPAVIPVNTFDDEDEEIKISNPHETPIVRDPEDSDGVSEIDVNNDDQGSVVTRFDRILG